jgi:LmbE family N-acetylglucosaminyl deacetylase
MLKRLTVTLILSILLLPLAYSQAPRSYTSSEILLQLKKLNTVGSVLYIAAHPDDENTRLISYLANEKCLRTGYLSLTRGDGGQNLVGPEQGIELGIIRTQELLAARRVDGGEQFFTRAYDFGFSKTPEETFQKWNHDSILADVVWVIRNFRPDIIITRFAPDGSGGHGHHTASAILAEEAFDAAADPNRFPEQLKYVSVWKTRRMFYNTVARFRDPNADMSAYIPLDVGGYNALLGKSYGEISAESRSMHKSQGFGSARQRGEYLEHFKPVKGDTTGLKDIFQGMDFTWKRVAGAEKTGDQISKIISGYNIASPESSIPAFEKVYALLQTMPKDYAYKVMLSNSILINMAGLSIDATASAGQIAKGSTQKLTITALNRSNIPIELNEIKFAGALKAQMLQFDTTVNKPLINNKPLVINFNSEITSSNDISQPHNLVRPIKHDMFDIDDLFSRNAPETFMNTGVLVKGKIGKTPVNIPSLYQYKWTDPEKGELYRPLVITPPVMINIQNDVVTFTPSLRLQKEIKITVKAGRDNVKGKLMINLPQGWQAFNYSQTLADNGNISNVTSEDFELTTKGQEKTISFWVNNLNKDNGTITLNPVAVVDGIEYTKGIREIKYDHIPVQTYFPQAEIKLVQLNDLQKKLKRIGYIPGAGDEMTPCLTQLGYEVVTITDNMLATENLGQYETIITGVRAYNTNEKLPLYKQRLMDYVAAGGNLIVQYNTNSFAGPLAGDLGPYKFKLTRDRVTDENAKVTFLLPDHPVLNTPNKITDKDFEGWIQERCIYSAGELAPEYVSPLSMADPNEKANTGSLIIAKHGKGNFIYTGLVFFREMPAGVPGAYRLFVNLIELGK